MLLQPPPGFFTDFPRLFFFPSVAFRVSRLTADQPPSNLGGYRTFATSRDVHSGLLV